MSAAIDYVAIAESAVGRGGAGVGIVELIEIDAALFGGESTAAEIAASVGVSDRTVERRRSALRKMGFRLRASPTITDGWTPERRAKASGRMRQRNWGGR